MTNGPLRYLKWFFSCKHPAYWLRWQRGTKPDIQPIDEDFEEHLMEVHCDKCGEDATLRFSRFRGGVEHFLRRRP